MSPENLLGWRLAILCDTAAMRRNGIVGIGGLGVAMLSAIFGMACTREPRDFGNGGAGGMGAGGGGSAGAGGSGGAPFCTPEAVEPCYSGPIGSDDIGICKKGTHTCNADGTAFGVCEGEVLPKAEDCTTTEDEACNGSDASECEPLGYVWSKVYGSTNNTVQVVEDIAVTPDGDLVVVGSFSGTIDFGGGPLASTGGDDIFVAKLKANGDFVWAKRFGDASTQRGKAVGVSSTGDIYVGGLVYGSVDFGDGIKTSAGSDDAFVAKLKPDGEIVWSKLFGDTSSQEVRRLRVTNTEQVVIGGVFGGTVNFGGSTFTSLGLDDVFVAKFDSSGFHASSRRWGGTGTDSLNGLAVDGMDAIILTGSFDTTMDFTTPLQSAGLRDVFVAKLSPTLSTVFAKAWGDAKTQEGFDVAMGPTNEIVVAGSFEGALNFDAFPLAASDVSTRNLFLALLGTDGVPLMAKAFGNAGSYFSTVRVALDKNAVQAVVTGQFTGTVDFGGGPLTSTVDSDIFLAKLNNLGNHVASRIFMEPKGVLEEDNFARALGLLPNGDPVIGGLLRGAVDFGGGAIGGNDPKTGDAFLARFLP